MCFWTPAGSLLSVPKRIGYVFVPPTSKLAVEAAAAATTIAETESAHATAYHALPGVEGLSCDICDRHIDNDYFLLIAQWATLYP